jgi:hypothetical protein
MTKHASLSTAARISLRRLKNRLNHDAEAAAGVLRLSERMISESMDAVGKMLLELSPPKRVEKITDWMRALEQIPSFRAGRMGQLSNHQINAALIGP